MTQPHELSLVASTDQVSVHLWTSTYVCPLHGISPIPFLSPFCHPSPGQVLPNTNEQPWPPLLALPATLRPEPASSFRAFVTVSFCVWRLNGWLSFLCKGHFPTPSLARHRHSAHVYKWILASYLVYCKGCFGCVRNVKGSAEQCTHHKRLYKFLMFPCYIVPLMYFVSVFGH